MTDRTTTYNWLKLADNDSGDWSATVKASNIQDDINVTIPLDYLTRKYFAATKPPPPQLIAAGMLTVIDQNQLTVELRYLPVTFFSTETAEVLLEATLDGEPVDLSILQLPLSKTLVPQVVGLTTTVTNGTSPDIVEVYSATVEAILAPAFIEAPSISGGTDLSAEIVLDFGELSGTMPIDINYRWFKNGNEVFGLGTVYPVSISDSNALITAEVLIANAAGDVTLITNTITIDDFGDTPVEEGSWLISGSSILDFPPPPPAPIVSGTQIVG